MDCVPVSENLADGCREINDQEVQKLSADGGGEDPAELEKKESVSLPPEMPPVFQTDAKTGANESDIEAIVETTTNEPPSEQEAVEASDEQVVQEAAAKAVAEAKTKSLEEQLQQEVDESGDIVAKAATRRLEAVALAAHALKTEATVNNVTRRSSTEVRSATAEVSAANNAKAQLLSASIKAGLYAKSVAESLRRAEEDIKEIEEAPKVAAKSAADEAAREVQDSILKARGSPAPAPAPMAALPEATKPHTSATSRQPLPPKVSPAPVPAPALTASSPEAAEALAPAPAPAPMLPLPGQSEAMFSPAPSVAVREEAQPMRALAPAPSAAPGSEAFDTVVDWMGKAYDSVVGGYGASSAPAPAGFLQGKQHEVVANLHRPPGQQRHAKSEAA